MRIIVDRSRCVGAGQCVVAAPELFNQSDEDGLVVVLQLEPDEALRAALEAAIMACPTRAIDQEGSSDMPTAVAVPST